MKVKAKHKDGITYVRLLAKHPMASGRRSDQRTQQPEPAKFIQELRCFYNGQLVFFAEMGPGIAENPYMSFSFMGGNKGESVYLRWNDNTGDSEVAEEIIR